jgi:hypothetical protein
MEQYACGVEGVDNFTRLYGTDCRNFRGISLLPATYKMLSNILLSRLTPYAKEIIGNDQCGFRYIRSITGHIFCVQVQWISASPRYRLNTFSPAAFWTLKSTVPGHFTILWKSQSTSTPSGQLAREATECIYSMWAESVKENLWFS